MDDEQLLRYSRQLMLPDVDVSGQQTLLNSHALIVGLGGLGSPIALYLAAAGVGTLTLVDHDDVELSNLQRQIAHHTDSIGLAKVTSAQRSVAAINPGTRVNAVNKKLNAQELDTAVRAADIVLDATDNFDTRFALNDACWHAGTPLVSGAAIRWEGQVTAFDPRRAETSPCYRCLYPSGDDTALNCAENGVIAPLVGVIGTMQALEAIKLLLQFEDTAVGKLLYFDAKRSVWQSFKLPKVANCATCGVTN